AVDALVVLTERAAEIVRANGAPAGKVVVNRIGVRDDIAHSDATPMASSRGEIKVGYVGRFEHVKGVIDLAYAIRRVPGNDRFRVEFRGPAQSAADLVTKGLVARICASDPRVTIEEGVAPANVVSLLRSYDVLCCPSRCLE